MRLPQYDIGSNIGAMKVQAIRTLSYYGIVSVGLTAVAARSQLQAWFPWLTFPWIVAGLLAIFGVIMLMDHIFVVKAEYAYTSKQYWEHNSPTAKALKNIDTRLERIEKELGISEKEDS